MSNPALLWARSQMPRRKGKPYGIAKAVLVCLCDRADARNQCFPGQDTISRETGFGVTAVATALDALEEQGYITRSWRRHKSGARRGERTSDLYTIILSRPPDRLVRDVVQPPALQKAVRRARRPAPPAGPIVAVPMNELVPVHGKHPPSDVLRPRMRHGWEGYRALPTSLDGRWEDFRENGPGAMAERRALWESRQPDQEPPAWHYKRREKIDEPGDK